MSYLLGAEHFTKMYCFNPNDSPMRYPHFTDEGTKVQRGQIISRQLEVELRLRTLTRDSLEMLLASQKALVRTFCRTELCDTEEFGY